MLIAANMAIKIAIVGGADNRMSAPFENNSWEIWTCNNCFLNLPRITKIFEIHKIGFDGKDYYRRGKKDFRGISVNDYLRSLAEADVPVYMQLYWPIIPKSLHYPIESIVRKFGRYFTSSIAYMIALAIREGANEIGLYGINMGMNDEYSTQRPCIEYLIGYARGIGINVTTQEHSCLLFNKHMYGYEEIIEPPIKEILNAYVLNKTK